MQTIVLMVSIKLIVGNICTRLIMAKAVIGTLYCLRVGFQNHDAENG